MTKLGFGSGKSRRHIFVENVDKDGKPLGHYTCLTCKREMAA